MPLNSLNHKNRVLYAADIQRIWDGVSHPEAPLPGCLPAPDIQAARVAARELDQPLPVWGGGPRGGGMGSSAHTRGAPSAFPATSGWEAWRGPSSHRGSGSRAGSARPRQRSRTKSPHPRGPSPAPRSQSRPRQTSRGRVDPNWKHFSTEEDPADAEARVRGDASPLTQSRLDRNYCEVQVSQAELYLEAALAAALQATEDWKTADLLARNARTALLAADLRYRRHYEAKPRATSRPVASPGGRAPTSSGSASGSGAASTVGSSAYCDPEASRLPGPTGPAPPLPPEVAAEEQAGQTSLAGQTPLTSADKLAVGELSMFEQLKARSPGYEPSKFARLNVQAPASSDLRRAPGANVREPSVAPGKARADRGGTSPRTLRDPPVNADLDCLRQRWKDLYRTLDQHAADFEGAWLDSRPVRRACRNCLSDALLPYTTAYASGADGAAGWATPWHFCCPKCRNDFLVRDNVGEVIRIKLQLMGIAGASSHPILPDAGNFTPALVGSFPRV